MTIILGGRAQTVRYLLRSERLLGAQGLLPPGYTPLVEH
jgi:hypothetical protein